MISGFCVPEILFNLIFKQTLEIYPLIIVTPFIFLLNKHLWFLQFHQDVMPFYHCKHSVQFKALLDWYLSLHKVYFRTSFPSCQIGYKYLLPWANRSLWMSYIFDHWTLCAFCFEYLALLFEYVVDPQFSRLEEHSIDHCCFEFYFHRSSSHVDMTYLSLMNACFFHS